MDLFVVLFQLSGQQEDRENVITQPINGQEWERRDRAMDLITSSAHGDDRTNKPSIKISSLSSLTTVISHRIASHRISGQN